MAKGTGEAGENPLVPNAKLRQMYTAMLEARMLEEALNKKARGAKNGRRGMASIRGQEAIRVSTAVELGPDDLVSDARVSAGMELILGGEATSLLKAFSKVPPSVGGNRLLRPIEDAAARLQLVTGAALALKTQGRRGIVVVYARREEASKSEWKQTLSTASKLELPIIFVVLPGTGAAKSGGETAVMSELARAAGVPGMPVDAFDAVALYRVTQESLGRTRGGDGPVLVECVRWRVEGKRGVTDDPLVHLQEFLTERRIVTTEWFENTGKTTRKRLFAKKNASKRG